MDLLGQKSGSVSEEQEEASRKLQDVESHVNALDNALSDFQSRVEQTESRIQEAEQTLENMKSDLDNRVENNQSRIRDLEKVFRRLSKLQTRNKKRLKDLEDLNSRMGESFLTLKETIEVQGRRAETVEERVEALTEKVEELESEFVLDVNRQDWDIDQKLDVNRFKNREKEVNRELSKLRTSINALADELDAEDEIRVDHPEDEEEEK